MSVKIKVDKLPDNLKNLFQDDGGANIPSEIPIKYRSPWHDAEEAKRSRRDFASNIWRTPFASSESVFDEKILKEIETKFIRPPDFEGEVGFDYKPNGKIDFETVRFWINLGNKRLKLWGQFPKGRPRQDHNYIIACDISLGLGNTNSTLEIYDVNTGEQIGEWADPNTKPENFADFAVAVAYWVGGVNKTFLIWESNGGQGTSFCNRVLWQGYYNIYIQTKETEKSRKRTRKYGWRSNTQSKADLLQDLSIALAEGIKEKPNYIFIRIRSENLLVELYDYIFSEKGKDATPSSKQDLGSGAKERHADRVIAAGLCVLGTRDQKSGKIESIENPPPRSFLARYKDRLKEIEKIKQGKKRYLY